MLNKTSSKPMILAMIFSMTGCGGGGGGGDSETNQDTSGGSNSGDEEEVVDNYEENQNSGVVIGTYSGTAELTVSYYPLTSTPAQTKTYTTNASLQINDPIVDDYNQVESNPFHISLITDGDDPGFVTVESAYLEHCDGGAFVGICDGNPGLILLQHWFYSQTSGSYSGLLQDEEFSNSISTMTVENIPLLEYDSSVSMETRCFVKMSHATQIISTFGANSVELVFSGQATDSGYQACAQYVESFTLRVTATR